MGPDPLRKPFFRLLPAYGSAPVVKGLWLDFSKQPEHIRFQMTLSPNLQQMIQQWMGKTTVELPTGPVIEETGPAKQNILNRGLRFR